MVRTLLAGLVFCGLASAQGVRIDPLPAATVAANVPPGAYTPILAIPGTGIKLCTDQTCAAAATTYIDSLLSASCPANAQVVWAGTAVCVNAADGQGNFGFWVLPGLYWYRLTLPDHSVYGPFPVTAGGAGGGSGVRTWNGRVGDVLPVSGDYSSVQILGLQNNVIFSGTPTFDLSAGTIQTVTLTGTATGAFLINSVPGLMYEFLICQDSAGNHSFTWPLTVHGGMSVGLAPGRCSLQMFLSASSALWAITPGVTNQ